MLLFHVSQRLQESRAERAVEQVPSPGHWDRRHGSCCPHQPGLPEPQIQVVTWELNSQVFIIKRKKTAVFFSLKTTGFMIIKTPNDGSNHPVTLFRCHSMGWSICPVSPLPHSLKWKLTWEQFPAPTLSFFTSVFIKCLYVYSAPCPVWYHGLSPPGPLKVWISPLCSLSQHFFSKSEA